jgi:hypothetical protein
MDVTRARASALSAFITAMDTYSISGGSKPGAGELPSADKSGLVRGIDADLL